MAGARDDRRSRAELVGLISLPITISSMAAALALAVLSLFVSTTPAGASSNLTFVKSVYFGSLNSVINGRSEMCLANPNKSQTAGTKMIQWPCNFTAGATEQQWALWKDNGLTDPSYPGDTVYQIRNLSSSLCLADPGASQTRGVQLIQWGCGNNGNEQRWVQVPHGAFTVWINVSSGFAMAVSEGNVKQGAPIIQWTPNNGLEQDWDTPNV